MEEPKKCAGLLMWKCANERAYGIVIPNPDYVTLSLKIQNSNVFGFPS